MYKNKNYMFKFFPRNTVNYDFKQIFYNINKMLISSKVIITEEKL